MKICFICMYEVFRLRWRIAIFICHYTICMRYVCVRRKTHYKMVQYTNVRFQFLFQVHEPLVSHVWHSNDSCCANINLNFFSSCLSSNFPYFLQPSCFSCQLVQPKDFIFVYFPPNSYPVERRRRSWLLRSIWNFFISTWHISTWGKNGKKVRKRD